MAKKTQSTAFQIQDLGMVVSAASKHVKALPPSAATKAKELAKVQSEAQLLNIAQEQAKAAQKVATAALKVKLKAGRVLRLSIVRLAEGTFGHKGAELADFRPTGEG